MGLEGITPERFAARLKKHRIEKGYSQDDLAKLSGLSKATICNHKVEGSSPSWPTILPGV